MAYREMQPPEKVCCPICSLPAAKPAIKEVNPQGKVVKESAVQGCTFFARCHQLKLADDKAESDARRSEMFRQFHADICDTCKLPKEECKRKRIQAYERKVAKLVREKVRKDPYIQGSEITAMLAEKSECRPPKRGYTQVLPAWWTPAKETNG